MLYRGPAVGVQVGRHPLGKRPLAQRGVAPESCRLQHEEEHSDANREPAVTGRLRWGGPCQPPTVEGHPYHPGAEHGRPKTWAAGAVGQKCRGDQSGRE